MRPIPAGNARRKLNIQILPNNNKNDQEEYGSSAVRQIDFLTSR